MGVLSLMRLAAYRATRRLGEAGMAEAARAAAGGDEAAVRQVVEDYFQCLYRSDTALAAKVFHPKSQVIGYFDDKLLWLTAEQFVGFIGKTPAPEKSGEAYDMKIRSLELNGATALAVVEDLYLGRRFTDTLSLLKVDGAWSIAAKVFRHDPR
jgi:hypothetical protein